MRKVRDIMIKPIQAIASKPQCSKPVSFGAAGKYQSAMNRFEKGEKLNINCCGGRELSVNGQKLDVLA